MPHHFSVELQGFIEYKPKLIATTIEGTPGNLQLLSPWAPPFDSRVTTVRKLSNLGIDTIIRFDPVFMHLFQALYGDSWFDKIAVLIDIFASTGAKHIIGSAGKLSRKRSQPGGHKGTSTWQRVYKVIHSESPLATKKFEQEYKYEANWSGGGYHLCKDLWLSFHRRLRELVEAEGMALCHLPGTLCGRE